EGGVAEPGSGAPRVDRCGPGWRRAAAWPRQPRLQSGCSGAAPDGPLAQLVALRGQVIVERAGLLRVLVELVVAQKAPGDMTPDHIPVFIDALAFGGVEVVASADADRLPPGEALEHHLVGVDLDACGGKAPQPGLEVRLADDLPAPGAVAGKPEAD